VKNTMWNKTILFSVPVVLGMSLSTPVFARDPHPALLLAQNTPADNTGRNERDRSGATLTPEDQSSNKADVELTRRIREAVVADKSLSTNAHNVKIITEAGGQYGKSRIRYRTDRNSGKEHR
jgi:hyperosmotically inducible periplasmic protein